MRQQITKTKGGFPIFVSPGGRWVYYISALQKKMWRVLAVGGTEEMVLDKTNHHFAVSPAGLYAAFPQKTRSGNNFNRSFAKR